MDKREIVVIISAILLIFLFFSGLFKPTGSAISNPKLLVSLDVPSEQQRIKPGQSIFLEVSLRVPGGQLDQSSNVNLEYSIKDLKGNIISSKIESGSIAVKESNVVSLLIPSTTRSGVYTAFVSVDYNGEIYTASKTIEVIDSSLVKKIIQIIGDQNRTNLLISSAVLLVLFLLIYLIVRKTKNTHSKRKR